jgi:hypothetical protein
MAASRRRKMPSVGKQNKRATKPGNEMLANSLSAGRRVGIEVSFADCAENSGGDVNT